MTERGALLKWLHDHLSYEADDCLAWPFSRQKNGYTGKMAFEGKGVMAHRVMCSLSHGAPPSPQHEVAHSCGKGHLGCVNPKHMRWATHIENCEDRLLHGNAPRGERCGTSKLKQTEVLAIRASSHLSSKTLASHYGVAYRTIDHIRARRKWAWLP